MSDLITIPWEDNFETTLTQSRNGGVGDVLVNDIPTSTIASGEKSYIVVNPGKSNMQVARVSWWSASPSKKFIVDSITVDEGNATPYTQKTHSANSVIRFSNNYQFWKDIQTAVNSKADETELVSRFANFTLTNSEIEASGNMTFKDDNNPAITLTQLASGSGSDTKVAITNNDTTTGTLDVKLTAGDGIKKTVVNPGASETLDMDVDTADTSTFVKESSWAADEGKVPVLDEVGKLDNPFIGKLDTFVFGDGSDGDVIISTDTTLVRDMYYNNLTINSTKTLYPNWYRIFVKETLLNNGTISQNGNNWTNWVAVSSDTVWSAWWAAVNGGTLNAGVAWWTGWSAKNIYGWGSYTPATVPTTNILTYSANNWAAGGASETASALNWWVSKRWVMYNVVFDMSKLILMVLWLASFNTVQYKVSGSAAWWGGTVQNASSPQNQWTWGGGGSSWGLIWISAKIFNNAWTITAIGWNGGNGVNTQIDSWWGGGWHGGFLFLIIQTLTNLWTVTLTWGTWGTNGWWSWTAGANWWDWSVIQTTV